MQDNLSLQDFYYFQQINTKKLPEFHFSFSSPLISLSLALAHTHAHTQPLPILSFLYLVCFCHFRGISNKSNVGNIYWMFTILSLCSVRELSSMSTHQLTPLSSNSAMWISSFSPHIRKLRPREVKLLALGHISNKWQSQNVNLHLAESSRFHHASCVSEILRRISNQEQMKYKRRGFCHWTV